MNSKEKPIPLGNAVCEIGDILGTKNNTKVKRLPKGGAYVLQFIKKSVARVCVCVCVCAVEFLSCLNSYLSLSLSCVSVIDIACVHRNHVS